MDDSEKLNLILEKLTENKRLLELILYELRSGSTDNDFCDNLLSIGNLLFPNK